MQAQFVFSFCAALANGDKDIWRKKALDYVFRRVHVIET